MNKTTTTTAILSIALLAGCGGSADEESALKTELSMTTQDKERAKSASDALREALAICTTKRARA